MTVMKRKQELIYGSVFDICSVYYNYGQAPDI